MLIKYIYQASRALKTELKIFEQVEKDPECILLKQYEVLDN